jgi:hypothetical protein
MARIGSPEAAPQYGIRCVAANKIPVRELADVLPNGARFLGGALQADAGTRCVYSQTCHVRFAPNSDRQADIYVGDVPIASQLLQPHRNQ